MQSTQCVSCKHFITDQFCRAFLPEPIPELIFQGWVIHNHEIEGDQGLRYEAKNEIDSSDEFASQQQLVG